MLADAEPIVRLWMLRALVQLEGHKEFIRRNEGFSSDLLAKALGLGRWCDLDESTDESGGDFSDAEPAKFNARRCLAELRAIHRQAEEQSGRLALPNPLRQNVERLSKLLGLSNADADILAFAVLARSRLVKKAIDCLGHDLRAFQVFDALSVILKLPVADVQAALHPQSALARTGLLTLGRDESGLTDKLDVMSEGRFMQGSFTDKMMTQDVGPDDLLRGKVNLVAPGHLSLDDYGHVQDSLDILRPYLRQASESEKRGVNVFIHGAPGTGKSQLACALAAELGCELFEVASEDDDGDPIDGEQRLRAFHAAQSFFAGRRVLFVFDEAEDVFSGEAEFPSLLGASTKGTAQSHKAWVNRSLEQNAVPTLWLSNSMARLDPAFIRRFDMLFELPVPPKKQRQRIVQQACGELLDAAGVARMAEVETLAPAVVTRAASVVQAISSHQGEAFDAVKKAKALEHLIGNTLEAQGHAGLRRHDPNRLPELYDPAFIHADVDLAQVADGLRRVRTGRVCLYGPPGTGKTAYGRWLAEQLDAPLLVKRGSDLLSMWVGGTEANIARAFREAEREGAVLLIDEVDSFLQDRRGAQRSWEVTEVNEMLTQMESFAGVFIASTNLMNGLDQAALRRFDLKVKFDFLAPDQSVELMRRHCAALGLGDPDDAARQAVRSLRKLTPGDFAAAVRQNRFRAIASAAQLVEVLRGECAVKEGSHCAIGFVH
jgi:SpoVK/Ycf46/Vps4 family AAA+-type ATPase